MTEQQRRLAIMVGRVPTRARWVTAALLGVAFLLWLVLFAPRLLVPPASDASLRDVTDAAKRHELQDSRLKLQNDVRTTLLQGLGGLAVLVGAFFTYRQLHIAREAQVTERFTRAIDQLGHENLDVRLGGIYALERIANDSPQDRATVVEVLTAFVRDHAPWPPRRRDQPGEDIPIKDLPPLRGWAADVQAALTVLGRRKPSIGPAQQLDLTAIDLRGADLRGAKLQRADFFQARLQGATLLEAQLQEATFRAAWMQRAFLRQAQLQRAHLIVAQLQHADLWAAQLQEAYLTEAELQGAILEDAHLQGAVLYGAKLQGAYLFFAQLQGADLRGADLTDAYLQGADLQRADLTDAKLGGARCNAKTVWPDGFDWEAAGVKLKDGKPSS
jgi:uncharacterized protein YjbI with pentapeptide repeats